MTTSPLSPKGFTKTSIQTPVIGALAKLGARELLAGFKTQQFTVSEVLEHLQQAYDAQLNCYIRANFGAALTQAPNCEDSYRSNSARPLEGLPVGIKDNFVTKDVITTAASAMLKNFKPTYESFVTSKLQQAGAIFTGKLNCDEFAMGGAGIYSHFGPTWNPWQRVVGQALSPGGSSSGSAAAVAAGMVPLALGSDTGGSVRTPAAWCGIVGIKPTYGLCSRYGMVAFSSSLDQAGVLARNVEDATLGLQFIAGHDKKDATSVNVTLPFEETLQQPLTSLKGIKIGVIKELEKGCGTTAEVDQALQDCYKLWQSQGAEIISISVPSIAWTLPVYYVLACSEAYSNLARYDGVRYGHRSSQKSNSIEEFFVQNRQEGFGAEVKRRLVLGAFCLSSENYHKNYGLAVKICHYLRRELAAAFKQVDFIATPTVARTALPETEEVTLDPLEIYKMDTFTIFANLAGLPAISLPCAIGQQSKLPIGLQLLANKFQDHNLCRMALYTQQLLQFPRLPWLV